MLYKSLVTTFAVMAVTSLAVADDASTTASANPSKKTCEAKTCTSGKACDKACADSKACATQTSDNTTLTVADFLSNFDDAWKAASVTSAKCAAACNDANKTSACSTACKSACASTQTVTDSESSACTTRCADKASCTTQTASTKNSKAVDKMIKGAKCVVKATLHGKLDGISENSVRLVISVPGNGEVGVPILSDIPYCNRLFKNVGVGRHNVIVLQIPKDQVEAIKSEKTACQERLLAPVVTSKPVKKSVDCTAQWQITATAKRPKVAACQQAKPTRSTQPYQTTAVKKKTSCNNCPCPTGSVTLPKTAIVVPPPVALPLPAQYYPAPKPVTAPRGYASYYPAKPAQPGCKCGTGCQCKPAQASNKLPAWAHRMIGIATENAYLKARAELQHEQMELHDELVHMHAENARLEAVQEQREELFETLVESSIERVQLEAQVEMMQERQELLAEIASLRSSQQAGSHQKLETLTVKLEQSRVENAELKAKITELEETVKEISQKVARQPATIQVH